MKNQLFLLGTAKCGLNSLANVLKQNPEICFAQYKSPSFFELDNEYNKGVEFYREKYFEDCSAESWRAEAHHRNFFLPWVPERIKTCFPEARLIVILRNPIDRAYLHWNSSNYFGTESMPFRKALYMNYLRLQRDLRLKTEREQKLYQKTSGSNEPRLYRTYLDSGHYVEQLERYFEFFDKRQFKIIDFESFLRTPRKVANDIFEFLELPPVEISMPPLQKSRDVSSKSLQAIFFQGRKVFKNLKLHRLFPVDLKKSLFSFDQAPESEMSDFIRLWLSNYYHRRIEKLQNVIDLDISGWQDHDYDRQVAPVEVIPE